MVEEAPTAPIHKGHRSDLVIGGARGVGWFGLRFSGAAGIGRNKMLLAGPLGNGDVEIPHSRVNTSHHFGANRSSWRRCCRPSRRRRCHDLVPCANGPSRGAGAAWHG